MASEYAVVVRDVISEADRQAAAARSGQHLNKGVALAQLLEEVGLRYRPASVRSWMRGDSMPPAEVLLAVAGTVGISLDQKLGADREPGEVERLNVELSEMHQILDEHERQIAALSAAGSLAAPVTEGAGGDRNAVGRLDDRLANLESQVARFMEVVMRLQENVGTQRELLREVASKALARGKDSGDVAQRGGGPEEDDHPRQGAGKSNT